MTEQSPEQLPDTRPDPWATEPDEQPDTDDAGRTLSDAPADAAEGTATGYAVYNRTLGQYVAGVEAKKPSASQAAKRVPDGHTVAVVRV